MMRIHIAQQNSGFTIIEMMVALAIFAMVITTTVGALLILIAGNSNLQAEQAIMSNLSFAMDNMTREIRTGTSYYCGTRANTNDTGNDQSRIFNNVDNIPVTETRDCQNGYEAGNGNQFQGVAFVETGGSITAASGATRISYYFDPVAETIMRKVGDETAQSLVSSEIRIILAEFVVTGAERALGSAPTDLTQPSVTIVIIAEDATGTIEGEFYLQTTVSQRRLDL